MFRHRFGRWLAIVPALASASVLALGVSPGHAAVGIPVTYQGFAYGSVTSKPSADKPQSKLWHHDGSWWALMASPGDGLVRIHELRADHTWRNTGTVADTRVNSTGDALWHKASGALYVASRHASSALRVARFTYKAATRTWAATAGYPVTVGTGGSESASIDIDSLGQLWVTYTQGRKVWVSRSTTDHRSWKAPFNPAVPDVAISSDDISSLVAFNGNIGVLWSDQNSAAFNFAVHADGAPDGTWSHETALAGAGLVDDHVNIKTVSSTSDGRIFAAIKTSQGDNGEPLTATLTAVLVRSVAGQWSMAPAGTVADDHTRPILMIDETNSELYFIATGGVGGGAIYYKKSPLSNVSFTAGRGEPLMSWPSRSLNDATGSKEPVTATTGLVTLATADGRKIYYHSEMELAGGSTPPPADTEAPTVPLDLRAETVMATGVELQWAASRDNVGVAGYTIRRGGTVIGTSSSSTYVDLGVAPEQSYTYTVQAFDAAGNRSGQSASVTVTTPAAAVSGAITHVGATSAANTAESSLTVPAPQAQPGHVLLASVDVRGKPTVTPPVGWQLLRDDLLGTTMRKATYWRVATASEPPSYSWRFSAAVSAVGSIVAYSGVSSDSPIGTSAGQLNAKSTTITAPSVAVEAPGSLLVGFFGVASLSHIVPPTDMSERTDRTVAGTVTYKVTGSSADRAAEVGATGPKVATAGVAAPNIGQLVVLRPDQG